MERGLQTIRRYGIAAGIGALLTWLAWPHVFAEFGPVREKVVQGSFRADGPDLRVPIPAKPYLARLRRPFAVISRVRNTGTSPLQVRLAFDDGDICSADVPAGVSRRLDCAVDRTFDIGEVHAIRVSAGSPTFTLEYLELATHYGSASSPARHLIVGPPGFHAARPSPPWRVAILFVLFTLAASAVRDARPRRNVRIAHLALAGIVAAVLLLTVVTATVSSYALLMSDRLLAGLLLLVTLPVTGRWAARFGRALLGPGLRPITAAAAVGLVVGGVFWSYAAYQARVLYRGNVSGFVQISHRFFDRDPVVNERQDLRDTLVLSEGEGYDGQFFYLMAFDPFLTALKGQALGYTTFFDAPAYRYGRIGYSLLTKIVSLDRPERYPIAMMALVVGSLAASAMLLALIARQFGRSLLAGGLILLVPGFWQSVALALPEPVAMAFILAGFLCLLRQRWWAGGALLGASLLVRETSGLFVLAAVAGVGASGRWRQAAIVTLLAFLPVVLWKGYVAWVFWNVEGIGGLLPHPDDLGAPLAGIWRLWTLVANHDYADGAWDMTRAAIALPILLLAGAGLAVLAAVRRQTPMALTAVAYAALALAFNYDAVWLYMGNANRLSADLFVALALVFVEWRPDRTWTRWAFRLFWCATAWYILFGTFESNLIREGVTRWFG